MGRGSGRDGPQLNPYFGTSLAYTLYSSFSQNLWPAPPTPQHRAPSFSKLLLLSPKSLLKHIWRCGVICDFLLGGWRANCDPTLNISKNRLAKCQLSDWKKVETPGLSSDLVRLIYSRGKGMFLLEGWEVTEILYLTLPSVSFGSGAVFGSGKMEVEVGGEWWSGYRREDRHYKCMQTWLKSIKSRMWVVCRELCYF